MFASLPSLGFDHRAATVQEMLRDYFAYHLGVRMADFLPVFPPDLESPFSKKWTTNMEIGYVLLASGHVCHINLVQAALNPATPEIRYPAFTSFCFKALRKGIEYNLDVVFEKAMSEHLRQSYEDFAANGRLGFAELLGKKIVHAKIPGPIDLNPVPGILFAVNPSAPKLAYLPPKATFRGVIELTFEDGTESKYFFDKEIFRFDHDLKRTTKCEESLEGWLGPLKAPLGKDSGPGPVLKGWLDRLPPDPKLNLFIQKIQ